MDAYTPASPPLLMDDDAVAPTKKVAKPKRPITAEQAREKVLAKLAKAGPKGAASLYGKSVSAVEAATYVEVITALSGSESPEIFVDRRTPAKPKYFLWSLRPQLPTAASVAERIFTFAQREHPRIHSAATLGKKLPFSKDEKSLVESALELLCADGRLTALEFAPTAKRTTLYAVTGAFVSTKPTPGESLTLESLKPAYDTLVIQSGFPAVPIASLQKAAKVPMDALKELLRRERDTGAVVLSVGDWSIAGDEERQGVIEMHGRNYLQVRWQT